MKKLIIIIFLCSLIDANSTTINTITRTNNLSNSVLTSAKYNADLNTAYDAVNNIISVAFKGLQSGCGLGYVDTNYIKVKTCILGVSGRFFQTSTGTNVTWGCTDCSAEATNSYYYVYAKNSANFTPFISGQAPGDDGYDASGDKVLGRFYNDASGEIYAATITDWSINGFIDRSSVFDLPVGSVVPSMLSTLQFQAINGVGWVLADGSDVSGSTYASTTSSTTVPDMRGQFLRGKNNSRSDGKENATGDLTLGTYQADGNKAHDHAATVSESPHTHSATGLIIVGGSPQFQSGSYTYGAQGAANIGSASTGITVDNAADGNTESTVKNITVNYFIRIN